MIDVQKCALIGYSLKPEELKPVLGTVIEYETIYVGNVKIGLMEYQQLLNFDNYPDIRFLVAGICINRTLQKEDPILINTEFLQGGYKQYNPPVKFEEKSSRFLKLLYVHFGKENKEFELNSTTQFPLAYSDPEEFVRIVDQLQSDGFITIRKAHQMSRYKHERIFTGVKVTNLGKEEASKALPKMPLFGLVSQEITTGNIKVDEKINHARKLFFEEPRDMNKMRSACESLCHILEPLRDDLKKYFSQKDVSDFFQIVNNFDIRHNKDTTKNILHEEQLEWVFYSLLNTINTYTKLKNKGV